MDATDGLGARTEADLLLVKELTGTCAITFAAISRGFRNIAR